ncbi:MAG: hypothetical protein LBS60_03070 [Deltaproteobacteria bacterium]|jgi:hypothetical protein|nr:hypothetical protein [Deltaproteobacteria bacterium]
MLRKLALINAGAIIALLLALGFRQIAGSSGVASAIFILFLAVIIIAYFYFSYITLFKKVENEPVAFDGKKIQSIPQYIQLLTDYVQNNVYTFKRDLLSIIKSCENFVKKQDLLFSTLQNYFDKNELSYQKFASVINGIENSFAVTVNNVLIRLNAFDEKEYEDIFRKKKIQSENLEKRQKIFDEYVQFLKSTSEFLDEILIKMDQLQLEISKLTSLDYHDIENIELLKEIDVLIKTMKLYKS